MNKIKHFYENIIGSSPAEFTLVDYPTMDDRSVMNLKSSDRLKQEVDKEQGLTLFKFQLTVNALIDKSNFKGI